MRLTSSALRLSSKLLERLDYYGNFHPSSLTIQHFIDFGRENVHAKKSCLFLRKEIPVRLANIMKEIKLLPENLLQTPSVEQVSGWYEQSFEEVLAFENADPNVSAVVYKFSRCLDNMQQRHSRVVETMARGVIEMKEQTAIGLPNSSPANVRFDVEDRIQYFLDRFYMMRISIRLLIHQHLLLYGETVEKSQHIGCFDPHCDVLVIAQDAYENARFLCEQYYNKAPHCNFQCHSPFEDHRLDRITMAYVPEHLYYMLFELFKNALRAVVEFHPNTDSMPPVDVLICKGREDVIFKLSDQGGGVPRKLMDKVFKYMFSTAPKPPSPDALDTTPLAGYGYGLPIARLYAKYFNGDLCLNSVDGYGTDALIYLKVFPRDAVEHLPVYNKTSTQHYVSQRRAADWSEPSGLDRH